MADNMNGFIPADQFQPAEPTQTPSQAGNPSEFIPEDQFESHEDKYGSNVEMAKTALEGLASGVISRPATSLIETKLLGVKPEAIEARREENPIIHGGTEALGLLGSLATGVGEGRLITEAGNLAIHAAGLGELGTTASRFAKIGSSAVDQAAQMAVLESGNEADKMILNEPGTSAETALAHIGLAAALGGAGGAFLTGAVSPLWEATAGPKLESALKALHSRFGGVEGGTANAVQSNADSLATKAGVQIPDEFKAVIDAKPGSAEAHSLLSQSDGTIAGRRYQDNLNNFEDQVSNKIVESLGKSPSDVANMPEMDKYNTGRSLGETLKSEIEPLKKDVSAKYDKINEEFKNTPVSPEDHSIIADQILQKSNELGWNKAESDAQTKLANSVIEKMEKQENVEDIKKFITNLRDSHPYNSDTYQAAKTISNILKDNQERIISENIIKGGGNAAKSSAKLAEYNGIKQQYKGLMDKLDNLNEHLHVGRYSGPGGFVKALDELSTGSGERIIERLSGKTKANVLDVLKDFPETLQKVKEYHVDKLLSDAVKKAKPGKDININNLVKNISELSPQLKELIASPEQHGAIDAASQILESLKDPTHNFSNTARTVGKLTKGAPSPLSLLAALTGHYGAGILTHIANLGYFEGRDAVKLGMMRYMGSTAPVDAPAFKAMVDFVHSVQKGETLLTKATSNVFKPGVPVITGSMAADNRDIEKLDKKIEEMNKNPNLMQAQQGKVGHYLPAHQMELTKSTATALQYLQGLKPHPQRPNPLDSEIKPSKYQMARYNRALSIAVQPAIVLQHVKDGTIQLTDVQDLSHMYPSLYKRMVEKLSTQMMSAHSNEEQIPYKTRIGVSLFLGQALDSSMQPASIIAAQPKPQQPQQPQTGAPSKSRKGTNSLGKSNNSYKTPEQAAESAKANRD